ncbi:MAG: tRNA uridine(34) 5-carboxymethylaminomethyl modification radical SAM/GNAT enzyme Elp3 [Candidatus Bathyarchaeota archaeon]
MDIVKTQLRTDMEIICREIIDRLMHIQSPTRNDLDRIKVDVCREFHVSMPKNSEALNLLKAEEKMKLFQLLKSKPTRTRSGVNVIAAMSIPSSCPHGRCAYCPGGPEYNVPSSYTGHEPAAMRGLQNKFDPYLQVKSRIDQLRTVGHAVSKVELIIMGGTFPATAMNYQRAFAKGCLDAITGVDSQSLEETQRNSEKSEVRNVGMTFETRPDYCKESHVDGMLELGGTRVELGVQNIYDDIYRLVERGHTVQDVIDATRILKDAGLKVCYHMMPGLPGSNADRDLEAFETLFTNPDFMPDMLKIYPCLVIKSAKIYCWWKEGKYSPYTNEEAVNLLVEVKKALPPWVRVMRVQRDIPAQLIVAGVNKGDLRQIVKEEMRKRSLRCRCIRCREVGHRTLFDGATSNADDIKIVTQRYNASGGLELFISAEDVENDVLIGYVRLRFPSIKAHRLEVKTDETSIIRELHIYGPLVPLGARIAEAWQHRGYGKILLEEAEKASLEDGRSRVLVTSALGVREYFRHLGYERVGPYMGKNLSRKL